MPFPTVEALFEHAVALQPLGRGRGARCARLVTLPPHLAPSRTTLLRWPPPGGLPQRPDVRRLEGRQELYIYYASACAYYYDGGLLRAARLSKPFAFAALKTGIALVCTSSTSAPELAAVLL